VVKVGTKRQLLEQLSRIDGQGYKAYKRLVGHYHYRYFDLYIDRVQGDPFASPSKLRVRVDQKRARFPKNLFLTKARKIGLEDFLIRQFAQAITRNVRGRRGSGKSGLISIDSGGQEILERTACLVNDNFVEVRFVVGLPASGRRVLAKEAIEIFAQEIPQIVEESLFFASLDQDRLVEHVNVCEDQESLRSQLEEKGLVSFIADGSILPRESGVVDRPLRGPQVVAFESPPELRVKLKCPHRGEVTGLGIPKGITLIVGGGYHGKTTLLKAIECGIYNHIPGDGREYVVTVREAVKIRAEDGRRVEKVDISAFINNLPFGQDTKVFSTDNASGSTSQAANIMEALECGAKLLLIDEDTSATNFMVRDELIQKLVPKEKEPITPFIDQARNLLQKLGVSTILVLGGVGDYLEIADHIIMMDLYKPRVVTDQAHCLVKERSVKRVKEATSSFDLVERIPESNSLNPYRRNRLKVKARSLSTIEFGHNLIDLSFLEQLVDVSQTRAIADSLVYALRKKYFNGRNTLREALELLFRDIEEKGLEVISPHTDYQSGDYALPRLFEVAFALNRLRSLCVRQVRQSSK
jgi:predicted ABC-class ATPase